MDEEYRHSSDDAGAGGESEKDPTDSASYKANDSQGKEENMGQDTAKEVRALKKDIDHLKSDLRGLLGSLKDEGRGKVDDFRDRLKEAAEDMEKRMKERVKDTYEDVRDNVREQTDKLFDSCRETVKKNPLTTVAVSLLAGVIIGRFFMKK